MLLIVIIFVTVVNFIPGILSIDQYKKTLRKYAEGYMLYEWANKNVPKNSKLLTTHRSYIFSKYPFISYEFRLFVANQKQLDYFTNTISKKNPTHLLYNGIDHNLGTDVLKNCRGKLIKLGKKVAKTATRNPLSGRNSNYHDGYI